MPEQQNAINFEILRMRPENTNSVLARAGDECVIFDPWGRADEWCKLIDARGLRPVAIYVTHGHPDHICAAPDLAARYNIPWYLDARDFDLVGWGGELLDFFGMPQINRSVAATPMPTDNAEILPGVHMDIIASPGHTPGGVMFGFPDFRILLTGDTIFRDGVGRCDFPGGDDNALRGSIAKLYEMHLSDDTYIVHGHGIDSTIQILRDTNPYFHS